MILIYKQSEPVVWRNYRQTPNVSYEAKPELRDSLLEEQGYICAYCMRRIGVGDCRIEHIKCRSKYPDLQLEYKNMVVCCSGKMGGEAQCDVAKGDKDISFSPMDVVFIDSLSYSTKDGTIKSSSDQWNVELNEVLNLNNRLLKMNRQQALQAFLEILRKQSRPLPFLKKKLIYWQSKNEGRYSPYCGIVLYYIKKRQKQVGR